MKNHLLRSWALLLFLGFFQANISAQTADYEPGEIIIQFHSNVNAEAWTQNLSQRGGIYQSVEIVEQLSRPTHIWLLRFDETQVSDKILLRSIQREDGVWLAQFNHLVTMRETIPDDPNFGEQWQYVNDGINGAVEDADIDADLAWDLTTGGTTVTGDTIVVAALDDGVFMDHPDFQRNRWINHAEIPDNGIDDDGNGYVDDYDGWSIVTDDDNISGGGHGTPVAGIMGADGDNGIGVTGVSWYVKVMIIKNNFNTNEAAVLEAYSYALEQRLRYNSSGGQEGAFVVATNASWGVDFGQPENAPIWCNFYDTLGEAGIISCGATINGNQNVDEVGDLPTACPSDYLISVTNMNSSDEKVTGAGYGVETIDLGAFGANAHTLNSNGGYSGFGGTSGATPHVTGAIGLIYSLPCPQLAGLTQSNPAAAAQLVRNAILNGVDPNASLDTITTTGGRLNIFNSLNLLLETCDGCIPVSGVQISDIIDTTATLSWVVNDSLLSADMRWRLAGDEDWNTLLDVSSPYLFTDLTPCSEYELQIRSNCASDTLEFQNSIFFDTDGCCEPPGNFDVFVFGDDFVSFSWESVLAANNFTFRYRLEGETDWIEEDVTGVAFVLVDLEPCNRYEYQIRTNCENENTDFTEIRVIQTSGCGACLDEEYCVEIDLSVEFEYIQQVEIGNVINNDSGSSEEGYQDFGESLGVVDLEQGGIYDLVLTPGFNGQAFGEDWKIWIDFNQNGQFNSTESIYETPNTSNQAVTGELYIPADAMQGNTRMRILMRYQSAEIPCPTGGDGEVEDYCINIIPTTACVAPSNFVLESVDTTTAEVSWGFVGPAIDYISEYKEEGSSDWLPVIDDEQNVELTDLTPCTNYIVRVKTICSESESDDFTEFMFTTECVNSAIDLSNNNAQWGIAPNPVKDQLYLSWTGEQVFDQLRVEISNPQGQAIKSMSWQPITGSSTTFSVEDLPAGVYLINLQDGNQLWSVKRFVKID